MSKKNTKTVNKKAPVAKTLRDLPSRATIDIAGEKFTACAFIRSVAYCFPSATNAEISAAYAALGGDKRLSPTTIRCQAGAVRVAARVTGDNAVAYRTGVAVYQYEFDNKQRALVSRALKTTVK